MIKRKFNKQGTCPLCGCDNLTYETLKEYDGYISYFVTCKDCECSFEEDYELKYMEQNCIETLEGEEVL